ncbi:GDP-fucose synthetase [Devosia sp. Root685]|uniref:GDP-L-fucose synthase family protein n=1 Tax=Devosia sp. Root685 TaxID=1736587 RepID=UPI0006FC8D6A|nr:GDP-L-fucose synthase [Devosia sp. Root685]KRA97758.1 GDP-fucose synthetase [Devosia sp. Root685]
MAEPSFSLGGKTIWIAGHNGMVGDALMRRLKGEACTLLTVDRKALDLTRQAEVEAFVGEAQPDAIIVAAARVGGILANSRDPVGFLSDNLAINLNIARAAHQADIDRVLFLGSSCIYPKFAAQPISEEALLTGPLEPTNQWYALAKIAALKLAEAYRQQFGRNFIAAMPTNLYGPHDNFDLEGGHVLPALLRKAHEAGARGAGQFELWGTGTARREFLHVDDCADALVLLLRTYAGAEPVNIGYGEDIALIDLARLICRTVGFDGAIALDPGKPDGTPRKLLDTSRLRRMGWRPKIRLEEGLAETYAWYRAQLARGVAT